VLWLSATAVTWLARRFVRAGWPYVVRQGFANLYRPGSQTRAVTLALGFGAFLVSTIYLARGNLLADLDLRTAAARANVLFFDVQQDQVAGSTRWCAAAATRWCSARRSSRCASRR
jgi:putative ABC transport system permease protein